MFWQLLLPLLEQQTRSPAVTKTADCTGCQSPSMSSKVDDSILSDVAYDTSY